MEVLIDWQLYDDSKLIIDLKDVPAILKKDEYLEYKEDNIVNKIYLDKKKYERITNDYKMVIDFEKKICYLKLSNEEELSINIEGNIEINDKKILIEYNYGEAKKIIIKIKD